MSTHPVLRARAARAGRYLPGGAECDVDPVHAALSDLLAPVTEVQVCDGTARNARISANGCQASIYSLSLYCSDANAVQCRYLMQTLFRYLKLEYLQKFMWLIKNRSLDVSDHVAIFTHDLRQGDFPDLGKLCLAKLEVGVVVLVPEPVALFELLELNPDDAGESGADESALQRALAQAARKEVDVVHVIIHL